MGTTKDFNDTLQARIEASEEFRKGLLREAMRCLITDDIETGKSLLRDYIVGTIGFAALGVKLGQSPETLMEMLQPKADPGIRSFFDMVGLLQEREGYHFEVVDRAA